MACRVDLHDLFGLVREVLLNLVVAEFEDLQLVWESRLSCLRLSEVVNDFSVSKRLLNVVVVKVHDRVAVGEGLPLDSVVENHFFLAVLVDPLDLAIVTNELLDDLLVGHCLAVVLLRELQTEVFFLIGNGSTRRWLF